MPAKTTLQSDQPWPDGVPFSAADRTYFHGRRRETAELLRLIERDIVTLVIGAAGSGKTSLIQSGLIPSLADTAWLPVVPRLDWSAQSPQTEAADVDPDRVVILANPLSTQLLTALQSAAAQRGLTSPNATPGETLWEFFHRAGNRWWSARQRVVTPVIIIDGFESVFTTAQQNATARRQAESFLRELSQLAANRPPLPVITRLEVGENSEPLFDFEPVPIRIILVMREEFTAELGNLRPLFPTLTHCQLRIEEFTPSQARDVLMRGAMQGNLMTDGALDAVIAHLSPGTGVDARISPARLCTLAHSLAEERKKRGNNPITPDYVSKSPAGEAPTSAAKPAVENDKLRAQLAASEQARRRSQRMATLAIIAAITAFAVPQMIHRQSGSKEASAESSRVAVPPPSQPSPSIIAEPSSPAESPLVPPPHELPPTPSPTPEPKPRETIPQGGTAPDSAPLIPASSLSSDPGPLDAPEPVPADTGVRPGDSVLSPEVQRQFDAVKAERERQQREFLRKQDERNRRTPQPPARKPAAPRGN